jgi:hypothetical protein
MAKNKFPEILCSLEAFKQGDKQLDDIKSIEGSFKKSSKELLDAYNSWQETLLDATLYFDAQVAKELVTGSGVNQSEHAVFLANIISGMPNEILNKVKAKEKEFNQAFNNWCELPEIIYDHNETSKWPESFKKDLLDINYAKKTLEEQSNNFSANNNWGTNIKNNKLIQDKVKRLSGKRRGITSTFEGISKKATAVIVNAVATKENKKPKNK